VSGDKAKLSNGQEIDAKTLTPDPAKPGQFKAPEMDPTAIKPGAVVSMGDEQTSENVEEEGVHNVTYHAWTSDPHFAPHQDDDEDSTFHKAINFLTGKVHPADIEYHAHHLTKKHHHGTDDRDLDEVHADLISQGNHDVGGDATDRFINQVRDKGFERSVRNGESNKSPMTNKLREGDELMKWLTIAGIK